MSSIGSKKNLPSSTESKRRLIKPEVKGISVRRQCELLNLNRSVFYYQAKGDSEATRFLIREIDKIYTEHPFFGARRIAAELGRRFPDQKITRKRVGRLMRKMGIEAVYPKPRLSIGNHEHCKYPYLLKGLEISRVNQVWGTDITYIPTQKGYVYLVAIIDWHSRYVLSWEVSNSMETSFCVKALERAIARFGKPEIFNSDQGSQFTSTEFTDILKENEIRISMDGRGRCMDNIFTERLWRSVKYEEVYLKEYPTLVDARTDLNAYFNFYNNHRAHQALEYRTPTEVYFNLGKGVPPPVAGLSFLKSAA